MKTIKILRRIKRLANCISKRRRFGDEHRKTFGVIATDLVRVFSENHRLHSLFVKPTWTDQTKFNSTWNDNRIRPLTWSFVIDGRTRTVHLIDGFGQRTIKNLKMWTEVDRWTDGRKSVPAGLGTAILTIVGWILRSISISHIDLFRPVPRNFVEF